ncbi:unnamed protein product, partial [Allacma fusca]
NPEGSCNKPERNAATPFTRSPHWSLLPPNPPIPTSDSTPAKHTFPCFNPHTSGEEQFRVLNPPLNSPLPASELVHTWNLPHMSLCTHLLCTFWKERRPEKKNDLRCQRSTNPL